MINAVYNTLSMEDELAANRSLGFRDGTEPVIQSLRKAISAVIANIPNFTYSRPNDLAVRLGLDPKLAWNVGRCLEGSDPFASARFIPGPAGIRALLRAAKRRHVPDEVLDRTRATFEDFREIVQRHAGSRKNFNMLAAGLVESTNARADIEQRRVLFDGNTYLWGVQARTIFRTYIVRPSEDADTYDLTAVRGIIDFTRIRPNVCWRITLPSSTDDEEVTRSNPHQVPLDSQSPGPVPLLTEFCSRPLPQFRRRTGLVQAREFEFVEDSLGNTKRLTCVMGELLRRIEPRHRHELYHDFCVSYVIRTPARHLICDLLVHRDLFTHNEPPSAELYSDLFNYGIAVRYDANDRIPLYDTLEHVGSGSTAAFTPEIPRYPEILQYALESVGWNGNEFDFYRIRMQYPPIHTTLMLRKPWPA